MLILFAPGYDYQRSYQRSGDFIAISPVELKGGTYSGATPTGAWRLDSDVREFGGISGLLVEGMDVTAITDQGYWVIGRRAARGLEPRVRIMPMRSHDGSPLGIDERDAEDLTARNGDLFVSFEGVRPRIVKALGDGRVSDGVRLPATARVRPNRGLEALATLTDGRLLAITQADPGRDFPMFVLDDDGLKAAGHLPRLSPHSLNGADADAEGNLYVLHRESPEPKTILARAQRRLFGDDYSARVARYRPGADGLPDPTTAEVLAEWDIGTGIENMEGIAVFRDSPDGPLRLWLISDDDLHQWRPTLLIELEVHGPGSGTH